MSILAILFIAIIYNIHAQYFRVFDYKEYASNTGDTVNTIQMSLPLNRCGKNGDHAGSSWYYLSQCDSPGNAIWGPCNFGNDETCTNSWGFTCDQNNWDDLGLNYVSLTTVNPSVNGETCDANAQPNQKSTTTVNYMKIEVWQGATSQAAERDCPEGGLFTYEWFILLATGACVDQGGGVYYMATCTNTSAEIGEYSDATCSTYVGPHTSYSRACQKYTDENYFRRLTGCYVNGTDILANTSSPTAEPTSDPTIRPTIDPSTDPTMDPTSMPTNATSSPSTIPTFIPTFQPTTEPTLEPTFDPTDNPTTSLPPSASPTINVGPEVTFPDAAEVLQGLNNITTIYIVFGILFIFYIFICMYIWMNERRKRKNYILKFQEEADKEERIAYLRKKNLERKLELQAAGIIPSPQLSPQRGPIQNGGGDYQRDYHEMDMHIQQQNMVPYDPNALAEGR